MYILSSEKTGTLKELSLTFNVFTTLSFVGSYKYQYCYVKSKTEDPN